MPNQRYNEDGDGAGLPQKVKGSKGSEASFKETAAEKDDEKADLNNTGVKMPQSGANSLPSVCVA